MGDWKNTKLSEIVELVHGFQFRDEDFTESGIPVIKIGNVNNGTLVFDGISFISKERINEFRKYLIKNGDILMSLTGNIGRVTEVRGISQPIVQNYRVGKFEPKDESLKKSYLKHLLSDGNLFAQLFVFANQSAQANFGKQDLNKLSVKYPIDTEEQSTIATILTTIDQVIERTEQLITKYERIKTGLMQDLLIRGIDEQGNIRSEETHEFKDSVLGRIPVDWEVASLKAVCERIQDGTHFSPEISEVGEFMYITSKNIRLGELDLRNVDYITREAHESIYRRCSVEFGDVLLTKDGANTGNVCLNTLKEPISLLSSVAFLRGKSGVLSNDFLFQMLSSEKLQKTFKDQMSGNAITRTTLTKINATQIAVPKIDEQHRIISVLEKFDCNLSKEKTNLTKYHSMKTALMQDLLTGRVRVDLLKTN